MLVYGYLSLVATYTARGMNCEARNIIAQFMLFLTIHQDRVLMKLYVPTGGNSLQIGAYIAVCSLFNSVAYRCYSLSQSYAKQAS